MLRLITFGGARVERDGQLLGGAAGQRRVLALLSIVASARERGVSRDRVLGLLWPDADLEKARQALTQALYHARRALDADALFIATADLRLNAEVITSDVADFEAALDRNGLEHAVDLYAGPFLDGLYVNGAPEFERWVAEERARLARRAAEALERLADVRSAEADHVGAVSYLSRLAAADPLNTRIALKVMTAMASAGDAVGAIKHGRIHDALVREELGVRDNPAIAELTAKLRQDGALATTDAVSSAPTDTGRASPVSSAVASRPAPASLSLRERLTWRGRPGVLLVGAAAVVATTLVAAVRAVRGNRDAAPSDVVVIAPFRVAGADPALAFLREGMVDLLFTKLTDEDARRATDPGAVMAAWRRAGLADRQDVSRGEMQRVARQLRGNRLLLGSVVGTPERIVITASLLGVRDGSLRAQTSVEGSADSLTVMIDRVVARLLAEEAGVGARLAGSMSTSAPAVRAYLDGRAAYRRGAYRDAIQHFHRALERDAAFAMAGLGLADAAERINARDDRARGMAAAWAARAELTARDSIYLAALAGPRYPLPSSERELLLAWERAASVLSDRADVWHELGERLFFDGRWLGVPAWQARATAAFRRASEIDPTFAAPLRYLAQLAADRGDTSEARRAVSTYLQIDSVGDLAGFVRWRFASAVGDSSQLDRIRRRFAATSSASLRAIVLSSQYTGTAVGDAEYALAELRRRAARSEDRADLILADHALAVNRGDRQRADAAIEELRDVDPATLVADRLSVLDALFGGGEAAVATAAAERLAARRDDDDTASTRQHANSRTASEDDCVLTLWSVGPGFGSGADSRARESSSASELAPGASAACSSLAEAMAAVGAGAADAIAMVARVDSILILGPPAGFLRHYSSIALARLYAELGDRRRALAVIRRRPHMQEWPHYLASQLRDEGRLATALHDTTGAVRAFRHYLALREGAGLPPAPQVAGEVSAVREELRRFEAATSRSAR